MSAKINAGKVGRSDTFLIDPDQIIVGAAATAPRAAGDQCRFADEGLVGHGSALRC